jgi:ribosomal protein S18 acetylase RimI-like enzyme
MIREALVEDSSRIAEIHVIGWRYAYKDFIPMEFLINKMNIMKRTEVFKKLLLENTENNKIVVFEEENIIKGFMTIGNCKDEDKNNITFESEGLYIDPLFQRQNIGTKLVNYCKEEAIKQNRKEIVLWVFKKNINSISFYEKNKLRKDGKTKMMEKYNEEAIRMEYKIIVK